MTIERADVYGLHVSLVDLDEAFAEVERWVAARRAAYASNANVHAVMRGLDVEGHRHHVNSADLVLPDGMPIVWLLRHRGHRVQRVHGDDLMLHCCERRPAWRPFLLGGRWGQPERVADTLERRFPGLRVAGCYPTPVRPLPEADAKAATDAIARAQPDLVWVGLGTDAQDAFMHDHCRALGLPMIGVGSAFDLLAGFTRAAPGWVRRAGMQWAFRMAQEPARLGPRYLRDNPRFLARVAHELWTGGPAV